MKPEGESSWSLSRFFSWKTPEVTPEEKAWQKEAEARQEIVAHRRDASPLREEVYDDYTILQQDSGDTPPSSYDLSAVLPVKIKVMERLGYKYGGKADRKYRREFIKMEKLGEAYKKAVAERLGYTDVNAFPVKETVVWELLDIKAEEQDRQGQQSQTTPQP
jgi:hypothetical protein